VSFDLGLGRLLVAAGVRRGFEAFEVLDEAEQSWLDRLVAAVGLDFGEEGDDGVILLLRNLGQRAALIAGFSGRIVLHGGFRPMLESIVRAGRTRLSKPNGGPKLCRARQAPVMLHSVYNRTRG